MKPQKQLFRHNPEHGVFGDCHRTAIACLLDLDPSDVPHFAHDNPSGAIFEQRVGDWLQGRGLAQAHVIYSGDACSLEDVLQSIAATSPRVYCLFGGTSRLGCGHTVIVCDGEIVWDPSLTDSGIVGPMSDGFYWVTFLLPAQLAKAAA